MTSIKHKITAFLLLILPFLASAQNLNESLPVFTTDNNIYTVDHLSNGMNVYIARNTSRKGLFDISLVQKKNVALSRQTLMQQAADAFKEVSSMPQSFQHFLSRHAIAPAENGYMEAGEGYIRYRLSDLSSVMPDTAIDSTLLAFMDLSRILSKTEGGTSSLALVISGDVDKAAYMGKLRLLGLFVPREDSMIPLYNYIWDPSRQEGRKLEIRTDGGVSVVEMVCVDARIPQQYMQTSLPVMSRKLAGELGLLLKRRMESDLWSRGIHSSVSFDYRDGTKGFSDTEFKFSIECRTRDVAEVKKLLESRIASLLEYGLDSNSYYSLENANRFDWQNDSYDSLRNNEYLQQKCISAFLYDAPLVKEELALKSVYRNVEAGTKTQMFNSYMKEILQQIAIDKAAPAVMESSLTHSVIREILEKNVVRQQLKKYPVSRDEFISGGLQWTFDGGLNMIHRKMATDGKIHFCYAVSGGRHLADADSLLAIDGIRDYMMEDYLEANGINIKADLRSNYVRLEGYAEEGSLETLLTYLAAVSAQDHNIKVLGDGCYKMLVLVSGMQEEDVRNTVASYALNFRSPSRFLKTAGVEDDAADDWSDSRTVSRTVRFSMDKGVGNAALADMAKYVMLSTLTKEFEGYGVRPFCRWRFVDVPMGDFIFEFGLQPIPDGSYLPQGQSISAKEMEYRLKRLFKAMENTAISKEELAEYRKRAVNEKQSEMLTPAYYVDVAVIRYMENIDMTRYAVRAESVTAEQIRNFYATASLSNR